MPYKSSKRAFWGHMSVYMARPICFGGAMIVDIFQFSHSMVTDTLVNMGTQKSALVLALDLHAH